MLMHIACSLSRVKVVRFQKQLQKLMRQNVWAVGSVTIVFIDLCIVKISEISVTI